MALDNGLFMAKFSTMEDHDFSSSGAPWMIFDHVGIMAHYWNSGYTIGMMTILLKMWLIIGMVAILLEWWLYY